MKTVQEALNEFLAEQKIRLASKTYQKYEGAVSLFKSYLENYWPGHDDKAGECMKQGQAFCDSFEAQDMVDGFQEFLGYFMPRKFCGGQETMAYAGIMVKKLSQWLIQKGYCPGPADGDGGIRRMAKGIRKCAKVQRLFDQELELVGEEFNEMEILKILGELVHSKQTKEKGKQSHQEILDECEDHFWITKISPGKLWVKPILERESEIGPVLVTEKISSLCEIEWDIGGRVEKKTDGWRFTEVWNVSP